MKPRLLAGLAAAAALTLSGCLGGGGKRAGGPDPASVVPPGAAFYADAQLKPEGETARDVEAVLRGLFSEQERSHLANVLDGSLLTGASYRRDIEPWLDRRVGVFLTGLSTDDDGALLLATDDPQQARRTVEGDLDNAGVANQRRSYRGVSYLFSRADGAAGVVGNFAVMGSEPGFKQVVDASLGDSLAESAGYGDAVASLPAERLATVFVQPRHLVAEAVSRGLVGTRHADDVVPQLGAAARDPLLAGLSVTPETVEVEVSAMPVSPASRFATKGTGLIGDFPPDSWGVAGAGNVGSKAKSVLEQLDSAAAATARLQEGLDGVGLDLDRDLLSWLDDAALFVEGETEEELQGALVLRSSDPEASAEAIGRLRLRRLADLAQPVHVVQREDRVAIAYGDQAGEHAFARDKELAGSGLFSCASKALGRAVFAFVSVHTMLEAAEIVEAERNPVFAEVAPYLNKFQYLVGGWRRHGERDVLRLVAGVHCPEQ